MLARDLLFSNSVKILTFFSNFDFLALEFQFYLFLPSFLQNSTFYFDTKIKFFTNKKIFRRSSMQDYYFESW